MTEGNPYAERKRILTSPATHRLVAGEPGVGKTYLGCEIAEQYLLSGPGRRCLFLTFARNAVARIKQAYRLRTANSYDARALSGFAESVHINTFAGFFWWLVTSYGRYSPDVSPKPPWLLGSLRVNSAYVPEGYTGYTFEELQNTASRLLQVHAVSDLLSEIYPLIIVDEFQDVDPGLFGVITQLCRKSRAVLLTGPGQCIYRGLKQFDESQVMNECRAKLRPQQFRLTPLGEDRQRYSPGVAAMVQRYDDRASPAFDAKWPAKLKSVTRKTRNGRPKELETQAGLLLAEMKRFLRTKHAGDSLSFAILCSTNEGVVSLGRRLREGSEGFRLRSTKASFAGDDLLSLTYCRLLLQLLRGHWSAVRRDEADVSEVATSLTAVFAEAERSQTGEATRWLPLAKDMLGIVRRMKKPGESIAPAEKLRKDLLKMGEALTRTKAKLPQGSPSTPLTKSHKHLLEALALELVQSVSSAFSTSGRLDVALASHLFEAEMQRNIIFEKQGLVSPTQVMTIHRAKGREFDGVIVVLEDNHRALWKPSSRSDEDELIDLYRVAISRAKHACGLVAYEDALSEGRPFLSRLLPSIAS